MNDPRDTEPTTERGAERLAAHARDCAACAGQEPPLARIAATLNRGGVTVDPMRLSAATLWRLRPELERLATRALWRQIGAVFVAALTPLPLVLAYDAYLLRLLYGLSSALLPEPVAAYLVTSYAAVLLLLFAATYAAIPLVMAPGGPRRLSSPGMRVA
jgi:hypothetical protein